MTDPSPASPLTVGARELRANQAALLRRAGAGQRIVITVGGRPVAELGPIGSTERQRPSLLGLQAAGLVVAPQRGDRPSADPSVVTTSELGVDRLLRAVRG